MELFAFSDAQAHAIAERRGTPCFAYRLDLAAAGFHALASALPRRVILAYAVKANPAGELLSLFAGMGAWFDCASDGELERIRAAGVPGARVLYAGPGKTRAELELALAMGARVEVDGLEDLELLEGLLSRAPAAAKAPLAVSVRVHPAAGVAEGSRIIGGAGPSAFGVDEEALPGFLAEARRFERIRVAGLQLFAASNERDFSRLLGNHRTALSIAARMRRDAGLDLDLIDLGGGLGIPYSKDEAELDIAAFGQGLERLLEDNPWFEGKLVVEPGRWLAGPCGVYLAKVVRAKASRGETFAILEGGANHLLRPLLTGQAFPARAPGVPGEVRATTLAGPLCTSLDRLGSVELPPLKAGDLVMLGQAGAYGFTEAMGSFLSHKPPAEHWLEGPVMD